VAPFLVRRPLLALPVLALVAGALAPVAATAEPGAPAAAERRAASSIQHTSWSKGRDWRAGTMRGVRTAKGSLFLKKPRPGKLRGRAYEAGSWTSPWASPGFGATELIPSWEAVTTGDGVVKVAVRARTADGRTSSWDSMAEWALDNPALRRQSLASQTDDLGRVNVDTWVAAAPVTQWQVRVTLYRSPTARPLVRVDRLGAAASAIAPRGNAPTSAPGPAAAAGAVLDVPTYSQMTHTGHYPQWGSGGEAWCSPTSLAMVLGHHGLQPGPFPAITAGHADPQVDNTARLVYDHRYRGTGNWAFNTAYAATLTAGDAYVTRLRDLREAEDYIVAGIPLVISVAFGPRQLSGSPITSSNGHLLVVVGFEADGDVVVNDPAAASNGSVRRVYDRDELEDVWINASGGTTYVVNR
jgi:hypothetical protein